MKTQTVLTAINNDKQLLKAINQNSYSTDRFISDAKRYLNAIKKGTMINSIGSVSSSGMSRTIKFLAPEYNKYTKRYQYCNFFQFFKALGFSEARGKEHYFLIGGCGMDMIFHTNYTIIHKLHRLGFINKRQCDFLAQQTPQTI